MNAPPRGRRLTATLDRWLISPEHRCLWFGQAVSLLGDYMFTTTVVLWVGAVLVNGRQWAPAAVSGVTGAVAAGMLVAAPVAGVLVDRWDRRRVMLVTDVVRGSLMAAWTALVWLGGKDIPTAAQLAIAYMVVFVASVAAQFFRPARFALISEVVIGDRDRTKAAGQQQASVAVASVIGPPIAAPLLFAVGIGGALAVNAASFLVSYLAVRAVRPPSGPLADRPAVPERPPLRALARRTRSAEFRAGLRLFVDNRALAVVLVSVVVTAVASGPLNSLNVFFLRENLHAGPQWYGTMAMALGAGSIGGAVLSLAVANRLGVARTVAWGVLLTGLLIITYSRATSLPLGLALLATIGVIQALMNTAFGSLVMGITPGAYLGRVMALISQVQQLAFLASVSVCGWLVSGPLVDMHGELVGVRYGGIDAVFLVLGLLVFATGAFAASGAGIGASLAESVPQKAG